MIINQRDLSGSSGSISPDARNFAVADELPDWYQQLERQLDAAIVPDFNMLQEAAMLAGWTDQVMAAAARLYARNYRNQRVQQRRGPLQEAGHPGGQQGRRPTEAGPAQLLRRTPQSEMRRR